MRIDSIRILEGHLRRIDNAKGKITFEVKMWVSVDKKTKSYKIY